MFLLAKNNPVKYIQTLSLCLLMVLSVNSVQAVVPETAPPLTEDEAWPMIAKAMEEKGVYLKPYDFPLEVFASNKKKVALLDLWLKEGLLIRKDIRLDVEKIIYGNPRIISVAAYEYDLNLENPEVTEQGFSVGTPTIKRIVLINEARFIGYTWFAQVEFEWYIADSPKWVSDKRMKQFRITRRALKSKQQPFEKSLSVEWLEDEGWINWKPKPKTQPLF